MNELNILTVTAREFAKWILDNLKAGDSVAFALDKIGDTEYENWWFVKLLTVDEGYDSRIILIDYAGGGFPRAFPSDEDEGYLIEDIAYYFEAVNGWYNEDEKINIDLNTLQRKEDNK